MTIFLGCGFAAKYRDGGGNLSVPLQWMLGLQRLKLDAIWLELLPASEDPVADQAKIEKFQRQARLHGFGGKYCLLYQKLKAEKHELGSLDCIGISKRELIDRLGGPNVLLNLAYSIHPPLLLKFERRIFCDLDPSEIFYWMTKMELGQSYHHEFWTIGLNVHGKNCKLTKLGVVAVPLGRGDGTSNPRRYSVVATRSALSWKTFYPLVDMKFFPRQPRPAIPKFTTIGQWYWSGAVEVDGAFPDLSKKFAFERYLNLPKRFPGVDFELAMNIGADEPERRRLQERGWNIADPHRVARTPALYRRYIARGLAEFTAIKGVDVAWRTGWLSDRAAAFLASGRPVITEDTGAEKYLPSQSGFRFVKDLGEAESAVKEVLGDWPRLSKQARACAVDVFDSAKNLRNILHL